MNEFFLWLTTTIYGFIILSIINVILSTIKSVLTIKASRQQAAIINMLAYGFNTIVYRQLVGFDMVTSVLVAMGANLLGVNIGRIITDKMRKKDKLWKFEATIREDELDNCCKFLEEHDIPYIVNDVMRRGEPWCMLGIYSQNASESALIKQILAITDAKVIVFEAQPH